MQPQHSTSVFFCKQRGSWRSLFFTLDGIISVEELSFIQPQHSISVFFCKQRGSWRNFFFTLDRIVSVESVRLHATTAQAYFSVSSGEVGVVCSLCWYHFSGGIELHATTVVRAQHDHIVSVELFNFLCQLGTTHAYFPVYSGKAGVIYSLRWIVSFPWKVFNFMQPQHSIRVNSKKVGINWSGPHIGSYHFSGKCLSSCNHITGIN